MQAIRAERCFVLNFSKGEQGMVKHTETEKAGFIEPAFCFYAWSHP
ncbi:hypothetical protein [Pontibacter fetidus]|nr:hypothetical protein [Pontibacter fetidus]